MSGDGRIRADVTNIWALSKAPARLENANAIELRPPTVASQLKKVNSTLVISYFVESTSKVTAV